MKQLVVALAFITGLSSLSLAGQNEFCIGFTEGYKTVKRDMAIVPICPIPPPLHQ